MENFCLYCFSKSNLNQMHLFPRVIGGRWSDRWCCTKCNSIIGTSIEGEIKKHLFFAEGISQIGLLPPDKAFQRITIRDRDSGEKLKYVGGKLMGTAKMRTPSIRIAPPSDMRKLIINDVGKKFPNELDRYMREYDSGDRVLQVGNEEHHFTEESTVGPVAFEGKGGIPRGLLAKIAYEGTWVFQQFDKKVLQDFYRSVIVLTKDDNDALMMIEFHKSFAKRVSCGRPDILHGKTPTVSLIFKPYHRLDFRVTDKDIAYVRIGFFGVLSYVVVMGKLARKQTRNSNWLNKAYFFPTEKNEIVSREYPEEYSEVVEHNNIVADTLWHQLTQPVENEGHGNNQPTP